DKKKFMQTAIVTQTAFLLILFAMLFAGLNSPALIYLVGFFFMLCNYSYNNSRNSIVKIVIPKPLLTSANAKFSFTSTLFMILGPTITGLILMFSKLEWGLLLTAIALGIAALSTSFVQMPKQEHVVQKRNRFFEDLKEGWVALRQNRKLWLLTMVVMINNAIDGMFGAMVVFYCKDSLQLNNTVLGIVFSAAGIGGLLGSMIVTRLRKKLSLGKLLGLTILCNTVSYALMFLSANEYLAGVALFIEGMFMTIFSICVWTFRQESTPSHLIGRVNGITGSFFKLAMPFTIFGAGWLADIAATKDVFLASSVGCLILFVAYLMLPLWSMKERAE
ncbi:MAG: MFS transporter, partial [Tumebacillaceae bacterium]